VAIMLLLYILSMVSSPPSLHYLKGKARSRKVLPHFCRSALDPLGVTARNESPMMDNNL
jgi:hypothetical protein